MSDSTPFQRQAATRRRGVVLLFVVVLLTLLAVLGSAYLVTSRIDAGQINPTSRGGESENFGPTAAHRLDQVMAEAQEAAQRKLFLDLFEYNGTPIPHGGTLPAGSVPSGARYVVDPDNDPDTASADELLWRATRGSATGYLPDEPVFNPMRDYGEFGAADGSGTVANGGILRFLYYHVDAEGGTDTHVASRLPFFNDLAGLDEFQWPWVSGPLVGVPGWELDNIYVDPLFPGGSPVTDATQFAPSEINLDLSPTVRAGLVPGTTGVVPYNAPSDVPTGDDEFYNDRLRQFPALFIPSSGARFTAADADGEGVADSGLSPIVFDRSVGVGELDRYIDPQTGYMYLVGMRIVDNNAAVNLNTAFNNFGDIALTDTAADVAATNFDDPTIYTLPNWGIHPSNVGLFQLFYPSTDGDGDNIDDNGNGATRAAQFAVFIPTLMGSPQAMHVTTTSGLLDPENNNPVRDDMEFASLSELLGQNNARRLENPFSAGVDDANEAQYMSPFLGRTDVGSLAFKGGGWIRPGRSPAGLENIFLDSFRIAAGNYVPDRKLQFNMFPLGPDVGATGEGQRFLRHTWAGMFKTADPDRTTFFEAADPAGDGITFRSLTNPDFPVSPRAGVVTRNGVSQAIRPNLLQPGGSVLLTDPGQVPGQVDANADGVIDAGMPSYAPDDTADPGLPFAKLPARPPVRANVNTARFNELWRAYWNVMVAASPSTTGNPLGFDAPIAPATVDFPDAFAIDSINAHNEVGITLTREQVLLLRAAIAAVNTMDLRDIDRVVDDGSGNPVPVPGDNDITVAEIPLGAGGAAPFARVYGTEAQPFIDEVVVEDDGTSVTFLGVELVNPYPFALDVSGWKLVGIARSAGTTPIDIAVLPANTFIPPADYAAGADAPGILYIDNGGAAASGETAPTEDANRTDPGPGEIWVDTGTSMTNADAILDGAEYAELLLVRPVRNDLSPQPASFEPEDYVPLDGVDFRGAVVTGAAQKFRYARPTEAAGTAPAMRDWDYTYGGLWDFAAGPAGTSSIEVAAANAGETVGEFGVVNAATTYTTPAPFPVAQLGPVASGPWKASDLSGGPYEDSTYPYGGLARDGDIVAVPFVGGYRLDDGMGSYDWVPVSLDLEFAGAGEAENTAPGRFYAFAHRDSAGASQEWWAEDLLDYLTATHSPGSDAFPNVDPRYTEDPDTGLYGDRTLNAVGSTDPDWADGTPALYEFSGTTSPAGGVRLFNLDPELVDNDGDEVANGYDDTGAYDYLDALNESLLPVQGLINLHTASDGILKTLPFVVDDSGNVLPSSVDTANSDDASRFYAERFMADGTPRGPYIDDAAGTPQPFTSLLQLPMISDGTLDTTLDGYNYSGAGTPTDPIPTELQPAMGDISGRIDTDGSVLDDTANFYDAVEDYEGRTLQLTRLSNLTTNRSDSYTVYIVVQAWEDPRDTAGGNHAGGLPELIRQKRTAFTVDRSGIRPFRPQELWNDQDVPEPWTAADVNGDAWKTAFDGKITPVPVK